MPPKVHFFVAPPSFVIPLVYINANKVSMLADVSMETEDDVSPAGNIEDPHDGVLMQWRMYLTSMVHYLDPTTVIK